MKRLLEEMAAEGNPTVQMVLPMAEMIGWLRRGVGELIRQAGLQLIGLLMDGRSAWLAGAIGYSPERRRIGGALSTRLLRGDGAKSSGRTTTRPFHRRPGEISWSWNCFWENLQS